MATSLRRRWFQFRLRTLLLAVFLLSLPLSWVATRLQTARKQSQAAEQLERLGCIVAFDAEDSPPRSGLLGALVGYGQCVVVANGSQVADRDLELLAGLHVKTLTSRYCTTSRIYVSCGCPPISPRKPWRSSGRRCRIARSIDSFLAGGSHGALPRYVTNIARLGKERRSGLEGPPGAPPRCPHEAMAHERDFSAIEANTTLMVCTGLTTPRSSISIETPMSTPIPRRLRPKWSIATQLRILTFSFPLIWLNTRSRLTYDMIEMPARTWLVEYGCPWTYARGISHSFPSSIQSARIDFWYPWPLAADVLVAVAAIALLTVVSAYLLRAAASGPTRHGFRGRATLTIAMQDGTIQHTKHAVEDVHRRPQ